MTPWSSKGKYRRHEIPKITTVMPGYATAGVDDVPRQHDKDVIKRRADWDDATAGLSLGLDALPEEAESLLERMDELERNLDDREA